MEAPHPVRPYKQNDLFRAGQNTRLNACVGLNGGPYDLASYSRGYFYAAQRLAANLADDARKLDVVIYPLVFVYRHGVELGLKHLLEVVPRLWLEKTPSVHTHRLLDNWKLVEGYLRREKQFGSDGTLIPMVDAVLRDFCEMDPTGQAFRYPEARSGSKFLQDTRCINVAELTERLDKVAEVFEFWRFVSCRIWDFQCESETWGHGGGT